MILEELRLDLRAKAEEVKRAIEVRSGHTDHLGIGAIIIPAYEEVLQHLNEAIRGLDSFFGDGT